MVWRREKGERRKYRNEYLREQKYECTKPKRNWERYYASRKRGEVSWSREEATLAPTLAP